MGFYIYVGLRHRQQANIDHSSYLTLNCNSTFILSCPAIDTNTE